jgi:DivIVA domain-containing protein
MGPDPSLTPELVQAQAFTSAFRGYDQSEVRDFLHRVAAELRSLRERAGQLESAWHSAEERAARPPVLDEDTLMAAVGEETASILRAARGAAAEMRSRAGDDAERIVADARSEGERIRAEAEGLLGRETHVAEEAAARIVEGARSEAAEMVDKARTDADGIRATAQHEKQLTIEGASATRERILDDLARRRRVAAVQIEQLRAGRERLLESYAVVRRTLEEVHNELTRADAEARAAADEAGRRMQRDHHPEPTHESAPADVAPKPEADEGAPAEASADGEAGGDNGSDSGTGTGATSVVTDSRPADTGGASPPEAAPAPPPARARRRGGRNGEGRGAGPTVTGSEALATATDEAAVPATEQASAVPHLRIVPDPVERSGGKVDQLFARIRAGRAERHQPATIAETPAIESPEVETPALETPAAETPAAETTEPAPAEAASPEGAADPAPDAAAHDAHEPEATRPDGDEALLQRREEAVLDLEMSLTRKLKRALQDEHNDLLDRLRNLRGEPTAARLLPNRDEQVARYASAAQPLVDKAAAAGVAFAVQILDRKGRANASAPPVADLARQAATSIVDSLRRRLEQAISASAGDEQQVMVEAVGGAYREWKSQRIERIAGDVLAAAFARGTWSEVPDGTRLRWIVDDADGPCPDCDDDALAGALPKGEQFPTGQLHPPAHTGCRCLLIPVPS